MPFRIGPTGLGIVQPSPATCRRIAAVQPKPKKIPHGVSRNDYALWRVKQYVKYCLAAAKSDLSSGKAEFEHLQLCDSIAELIHKCAPKKLQCSKNSIEMVAV